MLVYRNEIVVEHLFVQVVNITLKEECNYNLIQTNPHAYSACIILLSKRLTWESES